MEIEDEDVVVHVSTEIIKYCELLKLSYSLNVKSYALSIFIREQICKSI